VSTSDAVKQELGLDETDHGVTEPAVSEEPSESSREPDRTSTSPAPDTAVDEPQGIPEETGQAADSEPLSRWSNRASLDKIDQLAASLQLAKKTPTKDVKKIDDPKSGSDVMSMISKFQVGRSSKTGAPSSTGGVKPTGSVSDRLKMFGGGASYIKPPPSTHVSLADLPADSPDGSRETSPVRVKSLTRRSSSCLSVTAFETIAEESGSSEDAAPQEVEDDEVAPLPSIPPSHSRRQSEEKLRLDGLKLPQEVSKSESSVKSTESPPVIKRKGSGSNVLSPLMMSSSPKNKPRESSLNSKEALEMYMNSACLPHIDHIREKAAREVSIQTDQRVGLLLSAPRITEDKVPFEFRSLGYTEKNKLFVWKQKV